MTDRQRGWDNHPFLYFSTCKIVSNIDRLSYNNNKGFLHKSMENK